MFRCTVTAAGFHHGISLRSLLLLQLTSEEIARCVPTNLASVKATQVAVVVRMLCGARKRCDFVRIVHVVVTLAVESDDSFVWFTVQARR